MADDAWMVMNFFSDHRKPWSLCGFCAICKLYYVPTACTCKENIPCHTSDTMLATTDANLSWYLHKRVLLHSAPPTPKNANDISYITVCDKQNDVIYWREYRQCLSDTATSSLGSSNLCYKLDAQLPTRTLSALLLYKHAYNTRLTTTDQMHLWLTSQSDTRHLRKPLESVLAVLLQIKVRFFHSKLISC